jgi:UDP-N-acetylglucosamine--N-acetylmuramyl-(pentapeptide) pyrophosphoryl-undecaprenol N-acetylglucosamine transferase
MTNEAKLIILSAGGTGGHMFPAAALGRDLVSRGYRVAVVTDMRGTKFGNIFGDLPVHVLKSGTLGAGVAGKVKGMANLGVGLVQAHGLLKKIKPDVVVGFGGYPSVPAVYVAQRRKIPTVIHEQNAILGQANAFLAPCADRIALSIQHSHGLDSADAARAVVTGNPVRDEIAALYTRPYPAPQMDGALRIFITGGSLGAQVFSKIVPPALARLSAAHRARLDITQQCRAEDIESVRAIYAAAGIKARLATFFTDVAAILADTHLVIARSGASTVAEVAAAGRPAIFVPAPYHADDQQKVNADSIADSGGAWVMTQSGFTEEALLARVETFLQNPETLFRAAEAARGCGKPDAARRLGNVVTALASGWEK